MMFGTRFDHTKSVSFDSSKFMHGESVRATWHGEKYAPQTSLQRGFSSGWLRIRTILMKSEVAIVDGHGSESVI